MKLNDMILIVMFSHCILVPMYCLSKKEKFCFLEIQVNAEQQKNPTKIWVLIQMSSSVFRLMKLLKTLDKSHALRHSIITLLLCSD